MQLKRLNININIYYILINVYPCIWICINITDIDVLELVSNKCSADHDRGENTVVAKATRAKRTGIRENDPPISTTLRRQWACYPLACNYIIE